MNKEEYLQKIRALEPQLLDWFIELESDSYADYVLGYYYNEATHEFDVYINSGHGRHYVKSSHAHENDALEALMSLIERQIRWE
mgnify:CR=1 FL=1